MDGVLSKFSNDMKNQDTLDKAIKLLYLSDNELNNNQTEVIFKKEYKTKMSDKQKQRMLMQLKQKHVAYTLGNVLTQAMEAKKWNVQSLIEKAHVPINVMENLLADKIYANTLPVGFMKNILSILEIPFNEAANAIRTSFDSIKVQPSYNAVGGRPVARKSSHRKTSNTQVGNSKTKALFENEEALNKYLNHLEQIMEES